MKAIIIGTGRCGTRSISNFLNGLYDHKDIKIDARDHSDHEDIMNAVCSRNETNENISKKVLSILNNWQHDIEICHMAAFILPEIKNVFGDQIKIIHLIRKDKEACINSLASTTISNPYVWGNYLDTELEYRSFRPTLYHYDQKKISSWQKLSLYKKIEWLYDKHKFEAEYHLSTFKNTLTIFSEDLNLKYKEILKFLNLKNKNDIKMPWINRFANADYSNFNKDQIRDFEEEFMFFDWNKALEDKFYPLSHFLKSATLRLEQQPQHLVLRKILEDHLLHLQETLKKNV